MLGVDRVWAGKEEAAALVRGEFPDKLKQRFAGGRPQPHFAG